MVYESDFYTTRRPYTRPISSHYTVTVNKLPHHLPYIAHKKLVSVIHTPYPVIFHAYTVPVPIRIYSRVRPSVIAAELQRIRNQTRPSSTSYVSRYLNSKDNILFDDEAREIRARADSLLRRIHVFVPRPTSSDFAEVLVPERMRSDDYIRRVLTSRKNAKKDEPANWYESPEHRQFGTGNLASVTYTGGKPHSRRRPYYKVADLRAADVQSDVNLLSYYAKNRQAAASASRALAEDRVYLVPRKASPDPEPIYKPDLANIYQPEPKWSQETELVSKLAREPEPEPELVNGHEQKWMTESESKLESEQELELELKPEPEPIVETKTKSKRKTAKTKPIVNNKLESEPEPVKEPVLVEPEPVAEPKPVAESKPEPVAEPESVAVTELEPEVTELEPEPEKVEPQVELEPQSIEPEVVSSEVKSEQEIEETEPVEKNVEPIENEAETVENEVELVDKDVVIIEEGQDLGPEQLPPLENDEGVPVEHGDEEEEVAEKSDFLPADKVEQEVNQEEDDDVLQRKLDEEELRRQVEELKRQAEEEKRRQAEEARLAEERWKAEIEERVRLEEEARQARLKEIEEQERLEAARQAEEARIEAERIRDERIAEEQRRAAEEEAILALEEEERFAIEKASEEARKRQEREEKLVSEVDLGVADDAQAPESSADECHCHDNVNSHDREERPDSPDADDDTQIEEEAACISTDHEDLSEHPYDGEHEGFNSVNDLDTPVDNSVRIEEEINTEDDDDEVA
ncbi:calponin homology domain-containing protein DDB_G0272472 isoform X2 [Microplitis demolitor]|uniref:calponin homology domain-containing protein DDB_G0272472 isoform X2 n=1 Tax=Microplitis demolitor TaxID=69319 RepID=UPI0004CCB202|nr:calponin homology domain-containing protein DDB_G0272472 isoform X2 [Microplitis demolitor]